MHYTLTDKQNFFTWLFFYRAYVWLLLTVYRYSCYFICFYYLSSNKCCGSIHLFKCNVHSLINKTFSHDFSFLIVRLFSCWWQYIVTVVILYVIITSLLMNVVEAFTYFKCIIHSLINKTSSHDFSFIVGIFDYCWQYIVTVVILYVIITLTSNKCCGSIHLF